MKIISVLAGFFFLSSGVFAAGLPDARAPFKKNETLKPYKGKMTFDPKNMTYTYGDKQLVVRPNSTMSVFSGGRELLRSCLYLATLHKSVQSVKVPKVDDSYSGPLMNIRDLKIQGNSILFSGKIPWDKPGEKYINADWTVSYTPKNNSQIAVRFQCVPPKGHNLKDVILFMEFKDIKSFNAGQYGRWKYGTKHPLHVKTFPSELQIECPNPADNFAFHLSCPWHTHFPPKIWFLFRRNADGSAVSEFTIDLSNSYVRKVVKAPGGVDLLAADALHVPERGKNKFPNPYMAEKLMFFEPYNLMEPKYMPKLSTDAKFGHYSLTGKEVAVKTPAIPLDAGDYVLSYYVKGSGPIWNKIQYAGPGFLKQDWKTVRSPDKWVRIEFPFTLPMNTAVTTRVHGNGLCFDGFQLEKGKKATAFEAPAITAAPDNEFFFDHGSFVKLPFEFSTLEKSVAVNCVISVKNFFGEQVFKKEFKLNLTAGQYPKLEFAPGKLPDGLYVVKMDYGKASPAQYFRFAVMPFLKNTHAIAKAFSIAYYGHILTPQEINEVYLARLQKIGVGSDGHGVSMTKNVLDTYAKYNVIPFDCGYASRSESLMIKRLFPELNVPSGHTWFWVYDADVRDTKTRAFKPLLPDYRLVGGWNKEYREKFMNLIREQVRRYPQRKAYRFASEWAHEIKDDPHYPDLFAAYCEAVKSVYPKAWVFEAGDCNMDVKGGNAFYDKLLTRLKGKVKTDVVCAHTYTKKITDLYTNFRSFVDVVNRHTELGHVPIALPEGMSFYAYHVPAWNTEPVAWSGEGWQGGVMTYDLGWMEKLSAAYYARTWLIFLTEYDRLWAACSSSGNTCNFAMDYILTPRAMQKIPNTLGVLLGNPKEYLGNFTFAPETRCLVWKDEKDRPVAAVWNEDELVNSGVKDAPMARIKYDGAEYIDLMGESRKPKVDGEFTVSPFPLFIRGRAGTSKVFTKALAEAVLDGAETLSCKLSFEVKAQDHLAVTLQNPLSREMSGTLKIFNKDYSFRIAKTGSTELKIKLPKTLKSGTVSKVTVPYVCTVGRRSVKGEYTVNCLPVPKFSGDWKKIPAVKMTNAFGRKVSAKDLSASYQFAWNAKKLYMRVQVTDDVLNAGTGAEYRKGYDLLTVCFDTRCTALKSGKSLCDDDDYEYAFMPAKDGKSCDVWRIASPDMQLTLGISAPKNNTLAKEIPAKFTRTKDGYIYEAEFPADFLLPIHLKAGYNFGLGIYAADRDKGKENDHGLSNALKAGESGQGRPDLWPVAILTE